MIAACLIPGRPHYHRTEFTSGLLKLGYVVTRQAVLDPAPDDALLIWNRTEISDHKAKHYEARGARVLVAENGYLGRDPDGGKLFALARNHHNGVGTWFVGDDDRWSRLNIQLKDWRRNGSHILILVQRGFGCHGVAMPKTWPDLVQKQLRSLTDRPIRIREHPGPEQIPLEPDLADCWAAVTWASGSGIKAIVAGVPVFHCLKGWIGGGAARFGVEDIEAPYLGDRSAMLHRLAWAQWSAAELATGEPFRALI